VAITPAFLIMLIWLQRKNGLVFNSNAMVLGKLARFAFLN